MYPKKRYRIGEFEVMPLEVPHNVPNFAFVISHPEIGKLLYATDLTSFNYRIKDLTSMLIEANYSEEILVQALCENKDIRSKSENHLEINRTVEAIRNNFGGSLNTVILCHLSDALSDEKKFIETVYNETSIRPYAARAGMEIELKCEDF